jgi:hypothetical protein
MTAKETTAFDLDARAGDVWIAWSVRAGDGAKVSVQH